MKKSWAGSSDILFLCSWGLLSFVPRWGQRITSPLTSCCCIIAPGLRSIRSIRQRSATSRYHLLIPYSAFSLQIIRLSSHVRWRFGTQEISKAVTTRALFRVFAEVVLRKNPRLCRHLPSPAAQPVAQSEGAASPHTHLLHVAHAAGVCHTRVAPSHLFCSSQWDILTCCLSVFDNALAPGR